MEIQVNEKGSFSRELCMSVPWEECAPEYEKALSKLRRKIKLPGFRPGKVPKQVLVNQYQTLIEAEFIEHSIQSYYKKALEIKDIEPINQAKVSDVDFKFGQAFSFKATFEIEPTIALPKLKKNKLKESVDDFSEVININSNNYMAYFHRGKVKIMMNDNISAKSDFEKVLALKPENRLAVLELRKLHQIN